MIPTFDILIGRLLMHEHSEYVLKSDPGFRGIFDVPGDLPVPSQDGDFALVRSTGTVWWWNINVAPDPAWQNTYTPPESITFIEEQFVITVAQAAANAVLLSNAPRLDQDIEFTIHKSTPNIRGVDFNVSGSVLSWSGTLLDGKVKKNDIVSIKYYY